MIKFYVGFVWGEAFISLNKFFGAIWGVVFLWVEGVFVFMFFLLFFIMGADFFLACLQVNLKLSQFTLPVEEKNCTFISSL